MLGLWQIIADAYHLHYMWLLFVGFRSKKYVRHVWIACWLQSEWCLLHLTTGLIWLSFLVFPGYAFGLFWCLFCYFYFDLDVWARIEASWSTPARRHHRSRRPMFVLPRSIPPIDTPWIFQWNLFLVFLTHGIMMLPNLINQSPAPNFNHMPPSIFGPTANSIPWAGSLFTTVFFLLQYFCLIFKIP